jgi:hypothetical protein
MRKVISGLLLTISIFSLNILVFSWWINKTLNESSKITFVEKKLAKSEDKIFVGRTIDLINHSKEICELHHLPLEQEKLDIIYGQMISYRLTNGKRTFVSGYLTNDKKFPNSNKFVYGGMCPMGEPSYALVAYCSKCREAETHLRSRKKSNQV